MIGTRRALNEDGSYKYNISSGNGLGYYVHFRWTNYHDYGITYRNKDGVSASAALNQNHQKLLKNIKFSDGTKEGLSKLEEFLNGWVRGGSSGDLSSWAKKYNLSNEEVEEIEKQIYAEMERRFPEYSTNLYNLDLESLSNLQNLYVYKGRGSNNKKYILMSTFRKLYDNLEKSLREINKKIYNGQLNKSQVNNLIVWQTKIENILEEMSQIAYDSETLSKSGKSIFLTSGNKSHIERVIKAVGNMQKSFIKPSQDEQGEMAEIALSMFFALLSGKTANTTDELIEGVYKGKEHATNTSVFRGGGFLQTSYMFEQLNKTSVGVSKADKAAGKTRYQLQNGDVVDVIGSQQTTDLIVTLPDNFSDWGVNNLTASLKNYTSLNNIKILTETSLFIAFNFLENNFANHYLNIFASTGDTYDRPMAESYNDELKRALLVRGLMGIRDIRNPLSNTAEIADILILHSKSQNEFHIYNTGDLASNYFNRIDEVAVSGLPSQGALSNIWQGERNVYSMMGAMQRITKLILSARRIKLTVSLKNIQNIAS